MTIDPKLTRQHFNSRIYRAILHYIRTHYPDVDIEALCAESGLPYEYLLDDHNWVSVSFANKLTRRAIEITGCKEISYLSGFNSLSPELLGKPLYFLVSNVFGVQFLTRQIVNLSPLFSAISKVKVHEQRSESVAIDLEISEEGLDEAERRDVAENLEDIVASTVGYYSAVPVLSGHPAPNVAVERLGARRFRISIQWVGRVRLNAAFVLIPPVAVGAIYGLYAWAVGQFEFSYLIAVTASVLALLALSAWSTARTRFSNVLNAFHQLDQRYLAAQKEKERVEKLARIYQKFVPETVFSLLGLKNQLEIPLGHYRQGRWTSLAIDLRGFSALSERLTMDELFKFLNSYFGVITPILERNGGIVSNFSGDGCVCLFPNGPHDALAAAIEVNVRLQVENQNGRFKDNHVQIGSGIATGSILMGTVGHEGRMDVMISSDAVNLSARLEKMTKTEEFPILLDRASYDRLSENQKSIAKPLGERVVAGRHKPVQVFGVSIAASSALSSPFQSHTNPGK